MPPRSKQLSVKSLPWKAWFTASQPWPTGTPTTVGSHDCIEFDDLLISESHPYHNLGKSGGDIGGPFFVQHCEYEEFATNNAHNERHYSKFLNPNVAGDHFQGGQSAFVEDCLVKAGQVGSIYPNASFSSNATLSAMGSTAISRCIPTNPLAGLTLALAELKREGLPSLYGAQSLKARNQIARNAGSEYLNHQFGWVPLVRDIQAMDRSFRRAEELTEQYVRGSGKRIRREYAFPTVTTDSGEVFVANRYPRPGLQIGFYDAGEGTLTKQTVTRQDVWFSGCFTYFLAPPGSKKRDSQIRNYLYGTRLTPETLWNLAPWSWAADWVTNIGDVFHNVSAFMNDGLVMPYGYVMETKSVTHRYRLRGIRYKSYPSPSQTFHQYFTTTVKQRWGATPFGFGLDPTTFTSRQWAILAALGLSRSGSKVG